MQASRGNVVKAIGDDEDMHSKTVRGSDWAPISAGADFVDRAKAVRELAAWGAPWSRVQKGDRKVIIDGQRSRSPSATKRMDW